MVVLQMQKQNSMASFQGTRFPGPMFNQNFNLNPAGDRFPRPPFQMPPNVPNRSFPPPERFMHGHFQNRPPFSTFPDRVAAPRFGNRLPPPNQVFHMNSPPSNQMLRMNAPLPNQLHHMNPPPPNQLHHMNPPPPVHHMNPPHHNQVHHMNPPPPNQVLHMNPPPNQLHHMNPPPPNQLHMNPLPPNQLHHMTPPPPDQLHHMNPPPPDQLHHMNSPPVNQMLPINAPPPNQGFRMNLPSSNQAFHVEMPPNQIFRMNTPPPVSRPRFGGNFERPFRPWKQIPSFGKRTLPFQSRHRAPLHSHQPKDLPLQTNRKRRQKSREVRKLKDDSVEKPFACDTCDRAFVTENELNDHLSQHIKCDRANCSFEAHPKIVALHQKMQHDTGYAERISKLKDEAEIQKWREERKRRFPTAENIRKRKAEQAEREARGEVLETKEFGKFKRRREENQDAASNDCGKRMRNQDTRRNKRKERFQNRPFKRSATVNVDSESDSDSDSHITLKKFSGLSSLTNSAKKICIQNEDVNVLTPHILSNTDNENHLVSSETLCKQNLPKPDSDNISQSYESHAVTNTSNGEKDHTSFVLNDDRNQDHVSPADESVCEIPTIEIDSENPEVVTLPDSDDETPVALPIMKSIEKPVAENASMDENLVTEPVMESAEKCVAGDNQSLQTKAVQHHNKSEDGKETKIEKNFKADKSNKVLKKEHSHLNGLSRNQGTMFQARKSTLLEKLLADDIRHERNVILQCIRHIVNNNFFGISHRKS